MNTSRKLNSLMVNSPVLSQRSTLEINPKTSAEQISQDQVKKGYKEINFKTSERFSTGETWPDKPVPGQK